MSVFSFVPEVWYISCGSVSANHTASCKLPFGWLIFTSKSKMSMTTATDERTAQNNAHTYNTNTYTSNLPVIFFILITMSPEKCSTIIYIQTTLTWWLFGRDMRTMSRKGEYVDYFEYCTFQTSKTKLKTNIFYLNMPFVI